MNPMDIALMWFWASPFELVMICFVFLYRPLRTQASLGPIQVTQCTRYLRVLVGETLLLAALLAPLVFAGPDAVIDAIGTVFSGTLGFLWLITIVYLAGWLIMLAVPWYVLPRIHRDPAIAGRPWFRNGTFGYLLTDDVRAFRRDRRAGRPAQTPVLMRPRIMRDLWKGAQVTWKPAVPRSTARYRSLGDR